MYAETGLLFPYFQNFSRELQQLEEHCITQKQNVSTQCDLVHFSNISEYDLGGEGDLFKAPKPIVEEPIMGLDPMAATISMLSCSEDANSPQGIKAVNMDSLDNEQLLNNVFYECEKKLLEEEVIEAPLFNVLDIKIPVLETDENQIQEDKPLVDVPIFQKSVSFGSLSSLDWMHATSMKPAFMEFPGMDFSVYGMRRAYSEGDIKTLGNQNASTIQSALEKPIVISNYTSEDRQEKLSRYRNKRTKRNFGRKIKYACRKALADSQPRIRGRFAKTEERDAKRQ